jgi:hypothetical protein
MSEFNPSYAVIKEAIVESLDGNARQDLAPIVTDLELMQSINRSNWVGSITVLDATGSLENQGFKIRGEEELTLVIETFDLKMPEPLELRCQIISVTNVQPMENLTGLMFTLNFISRISYTSGLRRVRDSFRDLKSSEIAERIFRNYFGRLSDTTNAASVRRENIPFDGKKFQIRDSNNRHFYLQPSEGLMRAVIPSLMPSDAMEFLTKRSFSTNSPSCSYRFFETFSAFFFVTDEFLIRRGLDNTNDIEIFAYNAQNSMDPSNPEIQTNTFKTFSNSSRVNTASDVVSGAYRNRVVEVDLIRRRVRNIDFYYPEDGDGKYIDMSGRRNSLETDPHTREFMDETFTEENARRFLVFKDYYDDNGQSLRANQHFAEILQNRTVYEHRLGRTMVQATITGRLDLRPGSIIQVKVPKFTVVQNPESPYNEQLSGNYMIVSVSNQLRDNVLNTNLTLTKYDWSGDYIDV